MKRSLFSSKKQRTSHSMWINKIVSLKTHQNLGLSDKLKQAFPDVIPVTRPLVREKKLNTQID